MWAELVEAAMLRWTWNILEWLPMTLAAGIFACSTAWWESRWCVRRPCWGRHRANICGSYWSIRNMLNTYHVQGSLEPPHSHCDSGENAKPLLWYVMIQCCSFQSENVSWFSLLTFPQKNDAWGLGPRINSLDPRKCWDGPPTCCCICLKKPLWILINGLINRVSNGVITNSTVARVS